MAYSTGECTKLENRLEMGIGIKHDELFSEKRVNMKIYTSSIINYCSSSSQTNSGSIEIFSFRSRN